MCWLINKRSPLRNKKRSFPLIITVTLVCMPMLLCTCARRQPEMRGTFSIDSLLRAQASLLHELRASIDKEIILKNERETINVILNDTLAWQKELEVFDVMAAINKPVNRNRYQVTESADTKSNLRVKTFSANEDLPVEYVRLYYRDKPSRLRKLEGAQRVANGLFKSARLLSIEFDDFNGTPVMTSYSVWGGQKMLLDDTVQYDVKGRIKFKN